MAKCFGYVEWVQAKVEKELKTTPKSQNQRKKKAESQTKQTLVAVNNTSTPTKVQSQPRKAVPESMLIYTYMHMCMCVWVGKQHRTRRCDHAESKYHAKWRWGNNILGITSSAPASAQRSHTRTYIYACGTWLHVSSLVCVRRCMA